MRTPGVAEGKVYGKSQYCLCGFSVNLNLFQNKKLKQFILILPWSKSGQNLSKLGKTGVHGCMVPTPFPDILDTAGLCTFYPSRSQPHLIPGKPHLSLLFYFSTLCRGFRAKEPTHVHPAELTELVQALGPPPSTQPDHPAVRNRGPRMEAREGAEPTRSI